MNIDENNNFIVIKQIASKVGNLKKQISTLKGLGLGKINKSAKIKDTPAIRGMIKKVEHLVKIVS